MARRLGGQLPTFERIGEYDHSSGADVVEMFKAYGRRYYGSQAHEMELFFARDEHGGFAAKTIGITKPRQNGKSFAVRDYCLYMAIVEHQSVLYSAHHGRTVRKMFKEMCDFVLSHEDFKDELDYIYKAGGYEGIYFNDGTYIEFQTRTASGGRGGTYMIIVLDEAQELTAAQQDAIIPTVSAASELDEGNLQPQKIYIGTVPGPECQGTVFRTLHDRAHSEDTSVWWLEWGAQGDTIDDVDVDDVDLWYACNPAMGRRMSEETVRDEHDTMTRDGFARERLGWWSATAGKRQTAIPEQSWDELGSDEPLTEGRAAYGVKFAADGSEVVLAACRWDGETAYVEVIAREPLSGGLSWLSRWIADRKSAGLCCVIDGKAGAGALVEKLGRMPKNYIVTPSAAQVVSACSSLVDMVAEGNLMWWKPQEDLRDSATTSVRRKIGSSGGWGFGGENPVPVEACALALWGALNSKRNPERKQRIG